MRVIIALFPIILAACAANPKQMALTLKEEDPKYSSEECVFIRNKVLDYDDKVAERAMSGLALGLFLGPFGIPIAASMDAHQNKERELLNKEMERRCVTQVAKAPDTGTEHMEKIVAAKWEASAK